jgi:CDP-glycerol glycerophosphotransferase
MVNRYDGQSSRPAPFLKKAFVRSRARTHVTRFPWLISDRTAWNKLWRRDFLERHALRFSEGVFHEDIPMVIPAHYLARSVDVVAKPTYFWREREGGPLSITQRRLTVQLMLDRFAAVEHVCDFLEDGWPEPARRIYYESAVEEDLRYHVDVLDLADDEYRAVFMERANAFLARAGEGVESRQPAIQRLKWHLVRRRRLPELLEVVRFDRDGLRTRRTLRAGRFYGDYPFLDDPDLAIPRSVYRLDTSRRRLRQAWTVVRPASVRQR